MQKIYLITSLFAFSTLSAIAQTMPIDPTTNLITYSEVIETPDVSKNELYLRANTWFTRTFKSAKAVLELQDKEAGKLIGNGQLPIFIKVPIVGITDAGTVSATITIMCKDGKYKYAVDNLRHERPYGANSQMWVNGGSLEQEKPKVGMIGRPSKREWNDIKEGTDLDIKKLVTGLKSAMAKADADF
jgi:hypothetical protein